MIFCFVELPVKHVLLPSRNRNMSKTGSRSNFSISNLTTHNSLDLVPNQDKFHRLQACEVVKIYMCTSVTDPIPLKSEIS